jgi:hypothetical protein
MKMIDIQINWAAVFMETCSWVVVGTGVLYFCLGEVCWQALHDKPVENASNNTNKKKNPKHQ